MDRTLVGRDQDNDIDVILVGPAVEKLGKLTVLVGIASRAQGKSQV